MKALLHHVAVQRHVMIKLARDGERDEIAVDPSPRYIEAKRRAEELLAQLQRPA